MARPGEFEFYQTRSGLPATATLAEAQLTYWRDQLAITDGGYDEVEAAFYRDKTGITDPRVARLDYFQTQTGLPAGLAVTDYMAAFFADPPPDVVPPTSVVVTGDPDPMTLPGTVLVTITADQPIPADWVVLIKVTVSDDSTGVVNEWLPTVDGVQTSYSHVFDSTTWDAPPGAVTGVVAGGFARTADWSTVLDALDVVLYP